MAAPMTSSELFPAGIWSAETSWSACAVFHAVTVAWPHVISSALFEYQILMGPLAVAACEALPALPPPHAARIRPRLTITPEPSARLPETRLRIHDWVLCEPDWAPVSSLS